MKHFRTFASFSLLICMLCPLLCSCSGTNKAEIVLVDSTSANYAIIRPEIATAEELEASKKLFFAISDATSCPDLEIREDWYKRGTAPEVISEKKEILIGQTNRSESIETTLSLKYRDFTIREVGNKIVITGVSGEKTAEAVDYFIENYINSKTKKVSVPAGVNYVKKDSYESTGFVLGGTDISKYKIIYGTEPGSKEKAYSIRNSIGSYCGWVLDVKSGKDTQVSDYEILVGETNRNESAPYYTGDKQLEKNNYAIELVGTKLIIASNDKTGNAKACKKLLESAKNAGAGAIGAEINAVVDYTPNTELELLNFNIRYNSCNTENVDSFISFVSENEFDIFCLQEAKSDWINAIKHNLTQYSGIVTYRSGSSADEANPIFYNSTKYSLIESGTFWLSETPDEISIGWDATMRRICTWVILEDKETNDSLLVLNTQFDVDGTEARIESAKLISSFVAQKALPTVLTGDFASASGSAAFEALDASSLGYTLDLTDTVGGALNSSTKQMTFVSEEDFAVYEIFGESFPAISEYPAIIAKLAF